MGGGKVGRDGGGKHSKTPTGQSRCEQRESALRFLQRFSTVEILLKSFSFRLKVDFDLQCQVFWRNTFF